MPSKYKHIIWDWNGTLLDDVTQCVAVVNELLRGRGLQEISERKYREIFDFPAIDFYRRVGMSFETESYEELAADYMAKYTGLALKCPLRQDAEDSLDRLTRAGFTHSILSAYHQIPLDEAVDHFQLRKWFLKVVGMNDYYAHSKVENGRQWISELQYDNSEVLFVGDTLHDYETAQAMEVDCVLMSCGHQDRRQLQRCGVGLFDSLKELANRLIKS